MINTLVAIIIYLLISISTSHMWSHSNIMGYIRRLLVNVPYIRKPLLCPECASFWIGCFICLFFNPFIDILILPLSIIACGLITYTICGILYKKEILTDEGASSI